MTYSQTIIGHIPSKANCYKVITISGHGSMAKQKNLKDYENSFYMQCKFRDLMITDYFKLKVDVYYETMNPDLDNAFKILLDCMQQCKMIKNDNHCVEIHARKLIDKANPRIEFELETVEL